jgi:hypothetical protein
MHQCGQMATITTWRRLGLHVTQHFDFGIASIFIQGNRFYVRDQNIMIIELNYVGVLQEILVIQP